MVSQLEAFARLAQEPSRDLHEAWKAFAADLEQRLAVYEQHVMARPDGGIAKQRRITQEHAATRALVEEIDRQIARRRLRPASLELLAEILRARIGPDGNFHDEVDALS